MKDKNHVRDLSWHDVHERLSNGAAVILPIGASAKQHGLHLPLNTDAIQAEYFAAHLATTIDAVVFPTVDYGHYPDFTQYPGSVSLREETFAALVHDIFASVTGYAAPKIFVLNTGISTRSAIDAVIARLPAPQRPCHISIYAGNHFVHELRAARTETAIGHADEIETAIMLAIAPDKVKVSRATAENLSPSDVTNGPLNRADPNAPNYTPSGCIGDPRLATPEYGRALVEAIMKDITECVDSFERPAR